MLSKYKSLFILLGIFLVAFLLRTSNLSSLPYSMHADEVSNTFVGRYIFLHGIDPNGNSWPIFYFDKFGDYPPVLPMYLSGIATFLFGINALASRIPSALFGSLFIFPVFFLTRRFFNKQTAYIAALIIAIFPWHIVLSRASAEGIIALTVFGFALVSFLKGMSERKYLYTVLSILLFVLTYLLYPSFRIITPLALFPLYFFFTKKRERFLMILFSVVFVCLTLYIGTTTWGKGRFTQTSVFTSQGVIEGIKTDNQIFSNNEGAHNVLLARIFHNKVTGYYWVLANNYLSYFSPDFLFFQAGRPDRYVVPQEGLLLLCFLIFISGLFIFGTKNYQKFPFYYVLYLLAVGPLAASLTVDDTPNLHRSLIMVLPLSILIALGIISIVHLFHKSMIKKAVVIAMVFLISFQFIYFWHQYSVSQVSYKGVLRNDGNKELVAYIASRKNQYQHIVLPGNLSLPLYYLFYTNNFQVRKFGTFLSFSHIDNIDFNNVDCPSHLIPTMEINANLLVVDNTKCKIDKKQFLQLGSINRKDGTEAFILLRGR